MLFSLRKHCPFFNATCSVLLIVSRGNETSQTFIEYPLPPKTAFCWLHGLLSPRYRCKLICFVVVVGLPALCLLLAFFSFLCCHLAQLFLCCHLAQLFLCCHFSVVIWHSYFSVVIWHSHFNTCLRHAAQL